MQSTRAPGVTAVCGCVCAVVLMSCGRPASADETAAGNTGVEAKAVYSRLKTMAGAWKASISHDASHAPGGKLPSDHHPAEANVNFKLTGAGSALVETQFPGEGHEMVSVYHLDGEDLRMTHYCAAGNQPRLKLDRAHSKPEQLVFVFDGGSNLDPGKDNHIHGLTILFLPDGKVTSVWQSFSGGKPAETATFAMTRKS